MTTATNTTMAHAPGHIAKTNKVEQSSLLPIGNRQIMIENEVTPAPIQRTINNGVSSVTLKKNRKKDAEKSHSSMNEKSAGKEKKKNSDNAILKGKIVDLAKNFNSAMLNASEQIDKMIALCGIVLTDDKKAPSPEKAHQLIYAAVTKAGLWPVNSKGNPVPYSTIQAIKGAWSLNGDNYIFESKKDGTVLKVNCKIVRLVNSTCKRFIAKPGKGNGGNANEHKKIKMVSYTEAIDLLQSIVCKSKAEQAKLAKVLELLK